MNRLKERYQKEIVPALFKELDLKNVMQVPGPKKVVINIGLGEAMDNPKALETTAADISAITGQKPVINKARKSVSNFKLRAGMAVGLQVTLRGQRMYEFLDRLISLAIPRVKDFRGLNPSGFDGRGNYNMGLAEQSIFPEVDPAGITFTQGMNIAIQTSAKTDEEARELLSRLGMPFRTS